MAFDRQLATVLNLQTVREDYELIEFSVEQWAGDHLAVTRIYRRVGSSSDATWHEMVRIGPRGGTKEIYSSYY